MPSKIGSHSSFRQVLARIIWRGRIFGIRVEALSLTNADPKPFVWTADPDRIIEKMRRAHKTLGQIR